jgi:hypothetical protein
MAIIGVPRGCRGGREHYVLRFKMRAGLLGLLAMVLLGSYAATPAFAEGGPFCHHAKGPLKEDDGKIKAQEPENIQGQGTEQKLVGILGGERVTLISRSAQLKGNLYNNEDQCQAKVEIVFGTLTIAGFPGCVVTLPHQNVLKLFAHAAWTWNGEIKQLEEKPQTNQRRDWLLLPVELQQGATGLPKTEIPFTVINIASGKETCLLATRQLALKGSMAKEAKPATLAEFREEEEVTLLPNRTKQHFWNGREFIGVETGLTLNSEEATIEGGFKIKPIGRQQLAPQLISFSES